MAAPDHIKSIKTMLYIFLVVQLVCFGILFTLFLVKGGTSSNDSDGPEAAAQPLSFADHLYVQELYEQAAHEYATVLDRFTLPTQKAANIAFKVGELYLEKLGKYPEALAYFLKAENFDKEGKLAKTIGRKKVECLEKMKRSSDAQRVLEEASLLDQDQLNPVDASAVVAVVGDKQFTVRQMEHQIEMLPEDVRARFQNRQGKMEFLQQMVSTELIYNAAKRKGYGSNPKIIETINQFEKNLFVQNYIAAEMGNTVQITPTDVKLFYEAHKKDYEEKPFEEVHEQVARDYQQVKFNEALTLLFERLSAAEKVTLHPENITE